ncbi:MAG: c-type cytochrome [Gammaproteobacteria bacterium]|nr:c-type cytochrome [Gammaproteobacteria bacterium]MCP4090814.1 c-type cytochrome [Gammaproteobacteria bacterium]MCP4277241.1 c-type cytochrome [Gammaproteobacteria bacterium]MCP4832863.1 c-type cytochrome [Gammaproteobacteria bacterium]MCP4928962.1 c-type cytochrome [Gammaproteobacteria bacterium]
MAAHYYSRFRYLLVISIVGVAVAPLSIHASHPASGQPEFVSVEPTYPKIDYSVVAEPEAVRRGEYMAQIGDCIACHTDSSVDSQAFAGGLSIKTSFGNFFTPNITPDKQTGIGSWSEADFLRAMREGIRADGSNSFPAFPYVYFNRMHDSDLKDIWAYLQAIPAVKKENQGNTLSFPLDIRFLQYGWKALFFYWDQGEFEVDPAHSDAWNRGAYLVQGPGHCSMCHTPLNVLGSAKKQHYLTGAPVEGYWAPDITSSGLATATRFQVADVFFKGTLINKAGNVRGPMAEVNHDSLQYLTREDSLAIAEYLKSVKSTQPKVSQSIRASQPHLKLGKQVYTNACSACHSSGAAGAPRITDSSAWNNRVQARPLDKLYQHAIGGYNNMPAKGACPSCSDNEIKAAVDYMLKTALTASQYKNFQHSLSASKPQSAGVNKPVSVKDEAK